MGQASNRVRFVRVLVASVTLGALLAAVGARPAAAASGDLDTGFGGDGIATSATPGDDQANAMAMKLGDDRIVVAGSVVSATGKKDVRVQRWLSAGTLDASFGVDTTPSDGPGSVTVDAGLPGVNDDEALAVAINNSDGSIYVAGYRDSQGIPAPVGVPTTTKDVIVLKFSAAGVWDTSFGTGGVAVVGDASNDEQAKAIAIDASGNVVVAGSKKSTAAGATSDFFVARLTSAGALDAAFGTDGMVTTPVAGTTRADEATSMLLDSAGKILVAGWASNGTNEDAVVVRYTSAGAVDPAFDGDGISAFADRGGNERAAAVDVQSTGKIVTAGTTDATGGGDFLVQRFTASGGVDTGLSFGIASGTGLDGATALDVQGDDKVVVAGYAVMDGPDRDVAVVHLTSALALDGGFSGDGKTAYDASVTNDTPTTPSANLEDQANAVLLQADYKIVAAGFVTKFNADGSDPDMNPDASDKDIALARFAGDAAAELSIDDVSVGEGDGTATFTVTLSKPSTGRVTVAYATANGSTTPASAGPDYTSAGGTLTFDPGDTTETLNVAIIDDNVDEPGADETFVVNLTSPMGATILDSQGTGSITDNDGTPSVSVAAASATEGSDVDFTLTLSRPSSAALSVTYATSDGSAVSPADYSATSGTANFAAGTTTATASVPTIDDTTDEPTPDPETFTLTIALPDPSPNLTMGQSTATGSIADNDGTPQLSIDDVTENEGNAAATNFTFTVTLDHPTTQTVTVNYATANGTATAPSDYTSVSGTLTFPANTTQQTVTVLVNGDNLDEPGTAGSGETFFVNLSGASNAVIIDSQGQGTIANDDIGTPSISINDVTVVETDSGTTSAIFTVSLTRAAAPETTITVDYTTADGTATAPGDYQATTATLEFSGTATTRTISVPVVGDTTDEANETFAVNLSNASGGNIVDAQGIGTINDDDADPVLSIDDVTVTESSAGTPTAVFTVSLLPASGQQVTVDYVTMDGTATAGSDFTGVSSAQTLTFAVGETSKTISIPVLNDTTREADEDFTVVLSNESGAEISATDNPGTATIHDDDPAPTISIAGANVLESSGLASFAVTLSNPSSTAISVQYATSAGSATGDADYTTASSTLNFAANETAQTIDVAILDDDIDEANETFTVTLSSPTGDAGIAAGSGAATGTIIDDDQMPRISVDDVTAAEGDSLTFDVTLSNPSSSPISVQVATANGTTKSGDFTAVTATLDFSAEEVSETFTVQTTQDTIHEASETFFVDLSNPSTTATILDDQGVGTVTDDDPVPTISIADGAGEEGANASFQVTLSNATSSIVAVQFSTADGTATAGSDYTATNGGVTFASEDTSETLHVPLWADNQADPGETFLVNLAAPVNATILDGQAQGTIVNLATAPSLSIADVTVAEGDDAAKSTAAVVTLNPVSPQPVTVAYATSNGTATAPGDYFTSSGALSFAPGQGSALVPLSIAGDAIDEAAETFTITLSNPSPTALIGDGTGTVTITDDDGPVELTIDDVTVVEPDTGTAAATFTISSSVPSTQVITVHYATSAITATAGQDYAITSGTLTLEPGARSATVTVPVNGDGRDEDDETFVLGLTEPTNAVITDTTGLATIVDDDGAGYRMVAADGGVFSFGDAVFAGGLGAIKLNEPIVGMASTPSGKGYWLVARDGGIFAFGDALFYGSTGAIKLNQPIVGIAVTPSGKGYWLVASDGGVFAFGGAVFVGGLGGTKLNQPILAIAT